VVYVLLSLLKGFTHDKKKNLLFDISKVTLIVTTIPKYHFPNMSISKVTGNQSSRFPAMLSVLSQIRPSAGPYMVRCDSDNR